jgi:hypothetical protein
MLGEPRLSRLAVETISERILQSQLQLAHGYTKSQAADGAKPLVGSVRRGARNWRVFHTFNELYDHQKQIVARLSDSTLSSLLAISATVTFARRWPSRRQAARIM